ncbi:MAG: Flp pilus assembly complex ATPase component TadA [Deltaproteobacteria bacterium]|jgi:general secretion pathway protein A|nr:Flp pilus assembly complex ATPase component TadA [Deltaproteobacteria bacterium]
MYLIHYNLEIKPFESTPDPKFTWLGEKHKEALAALKYGIREDKGFILLTGDIGTGKTTLLNCFLNEIDTGAVITSVPDPDLTIEDFFRLLSSEFGIDIDFETRGEFLIRLKDFLEHTYSDQKKVLLIIDEAQRLSLQLLEQIRLLSNIQRHDAKLFSIFLVGQNELLDRLREEKNRALRQRIAVHCHIEPLTKTETRDYINHRLQVAGAAEEIFDPEAISEIFLFSQGCPRLINTICDRALLSGYASGTSRIDRKIAQKCADELALPGERKSATEKPATQVKKENNLETTAEKPAEVRKKNKREFADKGAEAEVDKQNIREAANAEPQAEADGDSDRYAEHKPETGANESARLTWGPGAERKPLRVSANDQELSSRTKSVRAQHIIMVAVAILLLTAIALYFWLGA